VGAETTVYVRVIKSHEEWISVDAVTLDEAIEKAYALPGVVFVILATYDPREAQ
jgi:hypothetical protein